MELYDKLLALRGGCVSIEGDKVMRDSPPSDDAPVPIMTGRWPHSHPEAIRVPCAFCGTALAISPKGYAVHQVNPAMRPILCAACSMALIALQTAMDEKAGGDA